MISCEKQWKGPLLGKAARRNEEMMWACAALCTVGAFFLDFAVVPNFDVPGRAAVQTARRGLDHLNAVRSGA